MKKRVLTFLLAWTFMIHAQEEIDLQDPFTTEPPLQATTKTQVLKPLCVLDGTVQSFLEKISSQGETSIDKTSYRAGRVLVRNLQAGGPRLSADIEDRTLPVGPRGSVSIRIVRPMGNQEVLPVIVYFHGGGWVFGDKDTYDRLIRELANGANAAVVFVNYSLSPEEKYPTALEEAYAATKWVSDNANLIGVNSKCLAVAGDSAGGNLATVVALLSKMRGGPKIRFEVLFYPVTDASFDTVSYQDFAHGYYLSRDAMKWFWNHYLPESDKRMQPMASPLRATTEQLKGMPPTLIITAECDVLRDEGEEYARKLMQAGVPVMATRYLGTIHDFVMLNALADTAAAQGAVSQTIDVLRKVFARCREKTD